jgi:hypothetical protein
MKATKHEFAIDYLLEILHTSETHEDFILKFYIYWVESVTVNAREFQQVLANAAVNKWFILELKKVEDEFKYIASFYPQLHHSANEMDKLQAKCYLPLMSIHPQVLVQAAKKREFKDAPESRLISSYIVNQN